MDLQPSENEALDTAAVLIKYSAESPKDLPNAIVLPIVTAWKAREEKNWSPEISSAFWVAYSALCDLLKPVTIDTIEASRPKIKAHKFIFFGPLRTISLTQRTARRYLILLLVLLVISTVSGFIVSVSNSLSTEIKALVGDGDTYVTQTATSLSSIEADLDAFANANENPLQISLEDTRIKPEVRTKIDGLRSRLQDLYYVQDRMHQKVTLIFRITSLSVLPIPQEGDLSRLPVLENGFDNVRSYYLERRSVTQAQQLVYVLNSLYTALVPLLLGAIGACTYVLRLMSQQIADTTFSSTSPIRHFVRVALGALAGVAIGLGGFAPDNGLSAAALAFLAGYAVEPVFATLDAFAAKFRQGT